MKSVIFYLGMATLFTHEVDAMPNHEWRIFPLTSMLSDDMGMIIFILAHIPLFALVVALVASTNFKVRRRSRIGISLFLIFHGLLHSLARNEVGYEFSSVLSNSIIFGGAVLGLVFIIWDYLEMKLNKDRA